MWRPHLMATPLNGIEGKMWRPHLMATPLNGIEGKMWRQHLGAIHLTEPGTGTDFIPLISDVQGNYTSGLCVKWFVS